ncbi:hypothetical protein [Geomicrobium sediminis]|uniref:Uncharacterized protein n=1 Tax=Geomicrobium sediminis TaxID=1347788 RepID=A0ABS2PEI6_9BACL|nr:hypothetical protein [Geomicrobium sediminis]MBM7633845.1 hypothetical protein [Geomicrobium sediminis]
MKQKHKQKRDVTIREIIQSKCKHEWIEMPEKENNKVAELCKRCKLKRVTTIHLIDSPIKATKNTEKYSPGELRQLMGVSRQIHHRGRGGAFRSK